MYEEQPTRQRGFGLRGGFRNKANQQRPLGTGGALGKIGEVVQSAMMKNPAIAARMQSFNKERGTPSSAVRTQAPKLYL